MILAHVHYTIIPLLYYKDALISNFNILDELGQVKLTCQKGKVGYGFFEHVILPRVISAEL